MEFECVASPLFGSIHCRIRMSQETVDIVIVRRIQRDADADPDRGLMRTQIERHADGFDDPLGDSRHIRFARDAFQNGGELISAHAADRIDFPDATFEPRRGCL